MGVPLSSRQQTERVYRKALAVLGLVADVDQERHNGWVLLHEPHDSVQAEVDTLHNHALAACLACPYQLVQALQDHLTLGLVALQAASAEKLLGVAIVKALMGKSCNSGWKPKACKGHQDMSVPCSAQCKPAGETKIWYLDALVL